MRQASAVSSAAISSLGLVLLILQLIDVFVRRYWVGHGIGSGVPALTDAPSAPLPFLWPALDNSQVWVAATAMLVPGAIAATLAIRSLLRAGRCPGLLPAAARLVLAAGTAAAIAQVLVTFWNVYYYAGGSTCDTVKLLPWWELSALLGLIGAAVGLHALASIGERTDRSPLKALSLGGATVGLGAAAIGLGTVGIVLGSIVGPQCPM